MKKNKYLLLPIIVGSLIMSACSGKDPGSILIPGFNTFDVNYLATKKVNFVVEKGKEAQLELDSIPAKIANEGLKFKSDDLTVATISDAGVVKGVNPGLATIHVESKDGTYDLPIKVYVTEALTSEQINSTVAGMKEVYDEMPKELEPESFRMIEYSDEEYYKNGVLDHGYRSMEVIDYDKASGYFVVGGDDLYIKTANGAAEKSSGTWVFTCLSDYQIRLIHITSIKKTFCEASIGEYLGDRNKAICDMLDSFFVSGKKIVSDAYDYHIGKDTFSFLTSELEEGEVTADGFGEGTIIYKETGSWRNQETYAYDELLHNGEIPAGTKTNDYQVVYNYYNGAKCEGVDIEVSSRYTLEGSEMERKFTRNMTFYDEFEKNKTYNTKNADFKKLGFKQVDDIFDL